MAEPLTPLGSALAGALGSVFANAVVYPLDTVKTRLQAGGAPEKPPADDSEKPKQKTPRTPAGLVRALLGKLKRWQMLNMLVRIIRTEGVAGAFKGFSANMINTFSMQFAYFFFHTLLRTAAIKRTGASLSTPAELALGAAAGALAQIFTIPVAVIATRQQLWIAPPGATGKAAREPSLLETAKEIVRDGGLTALWTGLRPGLVLTVNPAITYGVFERGKTLLLEGEGRAGGKLGVGEAFWLGVFSKTLATIVTYPYIFAKVRLQAKDDSTSYADAANPGKKRPKGAIALLRQVYNEQGISGWYQGLGAQIVKAVLCQGILFVSKEKFEDYARIIIAAADRFAGQYKVKSA